MFKFNFGNQKPNIKQYAILGIILTTVITSVSRCTSIDEKVLWDGLDEIQRRHFPQSPVNDFILQDPEKLQRRIRRDINRAINDVTPEYDRIIQKENQKYLPRYYESPVNSDLCYTQECKSLGGPMRMCAPFYDGCPDNFKSGTAGLTEPGI